MIMMTMMRMMILLKEQSNDSIQIVNHEKGHWATILKREYFSPSLKDGKLTIITFSYSGCYFLLFRKEIGLSKPGILLWIVCKSPKRDAFSACTK